MVNEEREVFIDSNILLYAYSTTEVRKKEKVRSIFENEAVSVSTQVINEFIWVMHRKYHVDLTLLTTISSHIFDLFNVALVTRETITQALAIAKRYNYSYWDSLILSSALETTSAIIYTEDMQHGQIVNTNLKIINPFI